MPKALVECVPNFSEARRPRVVEAIMEAVQSVPGVILLDRHSDLDHNRTVLTFVGEPQPVAEAAFRAIAKAAELIDLNQHRGEHPRIGATDVVPFVPIRGVTMQECAELARQLGKRVGEELGIPVYLYEEAATRPERKNLENLRRGEYEGLKTEIETNPERQPDFGPAKLGSAGATVIGARPFLIAYNIYLTTDDVSIAKKIAKVIRHSSGGLRFVKALGLSVEGRAQVSMNLTDFRQTAIHTVQEMVRREAARYGVGIHHSELVGLIPQDALIDSAVWYLQLDQFEPEQILERRLEAALSETSTPEAGNAFLDELAAPTPTPGGGSAAAFSAAAAAALVGMVARLTLGKKKYAPVQERMQAIAQQADGLCQRMKSAVARDAQAFEAVMNALRMPKESAQEQQARQEALRAATLQAASVPLEVVRGAVEALQLAAEVIDHGNLNAISDGGSAAAQAQAALRGAALNVRINLQGLEDAATTEKMLDELTKLEAQAKTLWERVKTSLKERANLDVG
ncbi:MAG: glutamate formimidoyltransferase [Anaerolineae bacterium]|jgi:glutamate formiminotransferase/formiminotetrahydrofolate cyclodeaminase|nr:MAG: glutamate formimidoyltransferase [Anaerolineae bacterium]